MDVRHLVLGGLPGLSGYLAGCAVGGIGAGMWVNLMTGRDSLSGFVWSMFVTALVVCGPTVLLGRFALQGRRPVLRRHQAGVWVLAGSLPPLVFMPNSLGAATALAMVPVGALAGLVAHAVETSVRRMA